MLMVSVERYGGENHGCEESSGWSLPLCYWQGVQAKKALSRKRDIVARRQAQAAYPRIKNAGAIHYTADDFDSSLATLTDKQVSSHYLVPAVPPRYNGKPRICHFVRNKNWPGMRGHR